MKTCRTTLPQTVCQIDGHWGGRAWDQTDFTSPKPLLILLISPPRLPDISLFQLLFLGLVYLLIFLFSPLSDPSKLPLSSLWFSALLHPVGVWKEAQHCWCHARNAADTGIGAKGRSGQTDERVYSVKTRYTVVEWRTQFLSLFGLSCGRSVKKCGDLVLCVDMLLWVNGRGEDDACLIMWVSMEQPVERQKCVVQYTGCVRDLLFKGKPSTIKTPVAFNECVL